MAGEAPYGDELWQGRTAEATGTGIVAEAPWPTAERSEARHSFASLQGGGCHARGGWHAFAAGKSRLARQIAEGPRKHATRGSDQDNRFARLGPCAADERFDGTVLIQNWRVYWDRPQILAGQ